MPITVDDLRSATSEELVALTERRHPGYDEQLEHLQFLELSYKGGRNWIEENLFQYGKEGPREFRERKKRAYRFPHSREVVSLLNKYVFKGAIDRSENPPKSLKEFWGAATLRKRQIQEYMEDVSAWSSTMGRVWVVVDNNYPAGLRSEQDRKESNGRIYSYFLKPTHVYDFAYDDNGDLEWFLNAEFIRDDKDPFRSSGQTEERFRLWSKNFSCAIIVTENNGHKTARVDISTLKEHNLGLVPIFPADHASTEDKYRSRSLIEDVAYLDRAVTNYLSCLDAIIQDQTFSQLAIPYQGLLPSEDDTDDEDANSYNAIATIGTKRIFAYNAEGGVPPEYISPDAAQAKLILDVVNKIVGEIYHSIGMAGERTKQDNSVGIDNSSGVAKAYDFERLNAMLASKARSLQNIEHNITRLVNAWNGDVKELEDTESYVTYPTTFDVRNLVDEMNNAQRLSVMNGPTELRRKQMERLAKKMFPQISAEEMEKIVDDIVNEWLAEPQGILMPGQTAPSLSKGDDDEKNTLPGKGNKQGENNKTPDSKTEKAPGS